MDMGMDRESLIEDIKYQYMRDLIDIAKDDMGDRVYLGQPAICVIDRKTSEYNILHGYCEQKEALRRMTKELGLKYNLDLK